MKFIKNLGLYLLAIAMTAAGVNHFLQAEVYTRIVPDYLPDHLFLVQLSGAAEVAVGIGLLIPTVRRFSAWSLIALLIAVFPANIYMYQLGGEEFGIPQWILLARLPLQLVMIGWAYVYTRASASEGRPL